MRYTYSACAFLILISLLFVRHTSDSSIEKGLLPDTKMLHIGIVVNDIESTLDNWIDVLGVKRPEVFEALGHEDNPTHYRGHLSDAKAKLAFIDLENIQVELIEPFGQADSHWKEFLKLKGEAVHHVAFEVKGIGEVYIENFQKEGYDVAQQGGWDGGEYAYLDGLSSLGVMIELIENYQD